MAKQPLRGLFCFPLARYCAHAILIGAGSDSSTHLLPLVTRGTLIASRTQGTSFGFHIMISRNVSLKRHSNYAIGGTARYFCHADGLASLVHSVNFATRKGLPIFILGGGTNVLFDDAAFKGLVIRPAINFIHATEALPETVRLTVGAGTDMGDVLLHCAEHGYSGLEWAGGLPGTVGGAIRGNAGAFGGEMKDSILDVSSFDMGNLSSPIVKRSGSECAFGYRTSAFKERAKREVVLAATFSLARAGREAVRHAIREKIAWRIARQPLEYPNVGSIFKNVAWTRVPEALRADDAIRRHMKSDPFPVIPAAFLIDQVGLKGVSFGGAMVSQKHPNFIVNACGAESLHVKHLIALVKHEVRGKFGIDLEEEIEFV